MNIMLIMLAMYVPSMLLSWVIIGYINGIEVRNFYNIFAMREYEENKKGAFSGLLFTEFTFRLIVATLIALVIFIAKNNIYVYVVGLLYTLSMTYTMYKSFAYKNRLLYRAQHLYDDLLGIRKGLMVLEHTLAQDIYINNRDYILDILEKFWDSISKDIYVVEIDDNNKLKFNSRDTESVTEIDKVTWKNKYDYAKNNLIELEKGILFLKMEISKY